MGMLGALAVAAPLALVAAGPAATAAAPAVTDEASCERAVNKTRSARAASAIPDKLGRELDEMLAIAGRLCAHGDFTHAGRLLAIARGMISGE